MLASAATWTYWKFGGPWWWFAVFILAPDLSMVGYLGGPKLGALTYNVVHTYAPAAALGLAGLLLENQLAYSLAMIWFAHIGADRALSFGLKYSDEFKHTHLSAVGG